MKFKNAYIKQLISSMSLDEKIGSLLTLGFAGVVPRQHIYEYITKYCCGGLRLSPEMRIFGSYVDPKSDRTVVSIQDNSGFKYTDLVPNCTPSDYKAVLQELQQTARIRKHSIPLHFSFDQEGGTSSDYSFGDVRIFPRPMGIRATGDPHMAYEVARAVAVQSKAVGFNWVHSPDVDISTDFRNPEIYTRAYSDRAEDVVEYAIQACKGFKESRMIATAKHFPGRGDSHVDAHYQVPVIDVDFDTLMKRELLPYIELIRQDLIPSIMIAHTIFPSLDPDNIATVSPKILQGLLREKLGFHGIIATDSMTMAGISSRYGVAKACALSLEAGADLVLMKAENHLVDEVFNTIRSFVETGRITEEMLDEKVYRVLNVKYEYGLFYDNTCNDIVPEDVIHSRPITELEKTIARRSVLIARCKTDALPLKTSQNILIVEQKVNKHNTMRWHSGILFESCLKYSKNVEYLETDYQYDDTDKERILAKAADKALDAIIITSYYTRGKLSNREFLERLIESTNIPIIIVSNTPFEEISIPVNANNIIVTFTTAPENIKVVAGVIFGETVPEGVWPLSKKIGE